MVSFPFCKINLGLQVVAKREDGFHDIQTCFYPVPWHDVLEIIPSQKFSFTQSGIPIPDNEEKNLCVRAYRKMQEEYDIPPVNIHLHKIIPMGAGLGGGSADAAFTLKTLDQVFALNAPLQKLSDIAAQLGSDCPFFLNNTPMLGAGRGGLLTPVALSLSGKFIVIVKPDIHVSTADAYKSVTPDASHKTISNILSKAVVEWESLLINDFERSVFQQYPQIAIIKEALYKEGAFYASMSGSGSAVFGLFDNVVKLQNRFEGMDYWSGNL